MKVRSVRHKNHKYALEVVTWRGSLTLRARRRVNASGGRNVRKAVRS